MTGKPEATLRSGRALAVTVALVAIGGLVLAGARLMAPAEKPTSPAAKVAAAKPPSARDLRAMEIIAGLDGKVGGRALEAARRLIGRDGEVLDAVQNQPEHARTVGEYVTLLVSPERLARGRELLIEQQKLLDAIEAKYGVDRHVVVAIWGIESNYGQTMGTRSVIRSLATLAAEEPRRAAFWRGELIAALKIIEAGEITAETMVGSWAGAMGHTQFIPSTYLAYAVDFDGDGKRDIWGSPADALASTANYLKASGWKRGERWGEEVVLPAGFDAARSAPGEPRRTWGDWQRLGLVPTAVALPDGVPAKLLLPAGIKGPAFLVGDNFRAILAYNNAMSYALAVGLLADRLAGRGPLLAAWPEGDRALARADREELQRRLNARGLDTGGVDGVLGVQTRNAIRQYQRAAALPEDGHPSYELLERLRREELPRQRPPGDDER